MSNSNWGRQFTTIGATLAAVLSLASSGTAATNYYADTFESYPSGTLLVGTSGWTGAEPDALIVQGMNYTNYTGGVYPLPGGHTQVLEVQSDATKAQETPGAVDIWVDQVVNPVLWDEATHPVVTNDAQMSVYFNTNGHPVILHAVYTNIDANTWTEIPEITVTTADWARVTVEIHYSEFDATKNRSFFRLTVSGVTATNAAAVSTPTGPAAGTDPDGGPWFPLLTEDYFMHALAISGTARLDDMRITDEDPFAQAQQNWTLNISHTEGGTIIPDGDVSITNGGNHSVVISNFTDFAIQNVFYDGVDQGQTNAWSFLNVTTNHSLHVVFTGTGIKTITASVEAGAGTISPTGAVQVAFDAGTNFTMNPASFWSIDDVKVDDVTVGAVDNYVFTNVTAIHTIKVYFMANKTPGGVPEWWLNQTLGATSDFTNVAATNTDGDAFSNEQEYWSSTDPDDPDSYLMIADTGTTNGTNYVVWYSTDIDPNLDPFTILRSTNLTDAAGWGSAGMSDGRKGTNMWMDEAPPAGDRAFYRIGATNVPPSL